MYEPKLPVTGVSFLALGMSSFFSKALLILLITTLSIILFRFIRLLKKEGNIKKLMKIIGLFLVSLFIIIGLGKVESNSKIERSKEVFNEYKKTLSIEQDDEMILNDKSESINRPEPKSGDIIGTIYIENISLELPIIKDVNDQNLWIGAAHIDGTPYYWEKGNSFISSHNIKTYGKLFNRLNELVIGDEIIVSDPYDSFNYVVYYTEIVSPDDTDCFKRIKGDYNLSLVTCIKSGRKRLIVYSERIDEVKKDFKI